MTPKTRSIVLGSFLSLSGCASEHPSEHGPYLSGGMVLDDIRLTIPAPTPYAASFAPRFQAVRTNAFGLELGAGYRINRFFSIQADGQFAVGADNADIRPMVPDLVQVEGQEDNQIDFHPKTFLRPALRGDLPLSKHLSVFATYGLQLEDIDAHTQFDTGKFITTYNPGGCTTNNSGQQECTPPSTGLTPEIAFNTYHHRDWRGSPTAGLELYGLLPDFQSVSFRVEYQPQLSGHTGSVTAAATVHF